MDIATANKVLGEEMGPRGEGLVTKALTGVANARFQIQLRGTVYNNTYDCPSFSIYLTPDVFSRMGEKELRIIAKLMVRNMVTETPLDAG